ncbi:MAG TPA: FAD:protein FMN transferase [Pontiella sp.]
MMIRRKFIQSIAGLIFIVAVAVRGCYIKNPLISGETMGTSYSITINGYVFRSKLSELENTVEDCLKDVSSQMSTWDSMSEISSFNASRNKGPHPISEEFALVIKRSLELSESTGGAFDPTLQPLLNLWGFGSEGGEYQVPSAEDIEETKSKTGWDKLWIEDGKILWKSNPEIQLALGAIAKGHGVDEVSLLLEKAGFQNWFVEVGGEVKVKGLNPNGIPWRIGIQYPTTNPMDSRLQGVLNVNSGAIATSGDYRNYIFENGVIYSHIIDPRSGYAVLSNTASVTVIAPSCMDADGIATALFVMGVKDGSTWIENVSGVEAMFLLRDENGEISEKFSSGFVAVTGYNRRP